MSSNEAIILSVFAIVLVSAVLAPLVWAAVLDGRYHAEQHGRSRRAHPAVVPHATAQRPVVDLSRERVAA